jgi:hypothetical protein
MELLREVRDALRDMQIAIALDQAQASIFKEYFHGMNHRAKNGGHIYRTTGRHSASQRRRSNNRKAARRAKIRARG